MNFELIPYTLNELQTRFDRRKSFYGKALIKETEKELILLSYLTEACIYNKTTKKFLILNVESKTTVRHVREFIAQIDPRFNTSITNLRKLCNK
jgi:hypothetical protein